MKQDIGERIIFLSSAMQYSVKVKKNFVFGR